jgi:hypothetical protein
MNGYLATVKIGLKSMWVAIGAGRAGIRSGLQSDLSQTGSVGPADGPYIAVKKNEAGQLHDAQCPKVMRVSTIRVHLYLA